MGKRMKKAASMLTAFAVCCSILTVFSFADIDPDTFNPRTGRYVYLISSNVGTFQSDGGDIVESVNRTSDGALIPAVKEYRYMIRNVYDSDYEKAKPYTEMLNGTEADDEYIDELISQGAAAYPDTTNSDGSYKYPINRSHFWWFKMSTETGKSLSGFKAPKVKWSGLYIYDEKKGGYQSIDLYMEVVGHSMAGSFSNRVPALLSVSKGVNGLPSVRIYHIKAIQLRFTAMKAGTNEVYPIKTSITFGDIDGRQSVSAAFSSTNGFAAKESANMLFGPYGTSPNQYWVATGNTDNNIEGDSVEADNYKVAFYLDAGANDNGYIDLAFTSSQKDNNRPSGNFARFSASTYQNPDNAPGKPVIEKPVKYVHDSDFDNDVDKGTVNINGINSPARSHNMLTDFDEKVTYTVVQKLPPHMYSNLEETDLSSFTFSDELDERLSYVSGSMRIYSVKDSAETDEDLLHDPVSLGRYSSGEVTSKFNISIDDDGKITASWKNANSSADLDRILYGESDGAVLKFVFDVKLKEGIDFDGNSVTVPNRAKTTFQFRSDSGESVLESVSARYDEELSDAEREENSYVYTSFENNLTEVSFEKVDADTGERVEGAKLSIYSGEHPGNQEITGEPICSWTTGTDAYLCEGVLEKGKTYTLVEEEAPEGYYAADRIVFTASGEDMRIVMEDKPRKHDVVISKNVTGSLGDITKAFKFSLKVHGANKDYEYTAVKGSSEYVIATDSEGNASFDFTLKDDEDITIKDLPERGSARGLTSYTIEEKASNHTASYVSESGSVKANHEPERALISESFNVKDNQRVDFTNSRDIAPVTGVEERLAPVVIIALLLVLFGACIVVRIK